MNSAFPAGYAVRAAQADDMQAILALAAVCQAHEYGSSDPALLGGVELTPGKPGFDAQRDAWLVETPDGTLAGYAHVSPPEPQLYAHAYVHPDHTGHGIGTYLARRIEVRARARLELTEGASPVRLHQWIEAPNTLGHALMEALGYQEVRHMWGMLIELPEAPEAPAWPKGITVRGCIGEDDLRRAHAVVNEAFRDHWNYEEQSFEQFAANLIAIPQFDPSLWFLALDGDEVVGAALCEMLPDRAWVNDLGVRRPWRRRGLGLALLRHAFGAFSQRGARVAALGVDSASLTGATRLYERAGMHVERQYDVFERIL
ncbi:MAG: GNAT family N-acetyltransferase [Ktedonobacterales bacterium]